MNENVIKVGSNKNEFGGLHFTTKHTGKMKGVLSISSSCRENPYCQKRINMKENSICKHCFADAQMKRYRNMQECFKKNTELLTSRVLDDNEIPHLETELFRIESFGDVQNWIQCANYFKIAKLNPQCKVAMWTKNPWLIDECIKHGFEKPENLSLVFSSLMVNKPSRTKYDFFDKVFTVYSPDFIEENSVNVNCGARSCKSCQRCYTKTGSLEYVNEKLK